MNRVKLWQVFALLTILCIASIVQLHYFINAEVSLRGCGGLQQKVRQVDYEYKVDPYPQSYEESLKLRKDLLENNYIATWAQISFETLERLNEESEG